MKFRFLTAVAAVALLAACESAPEANKASNVGGDKVVAPVVDSIVPGSQADFVKNVGDRVFFATDSAKLTPDSLAQLGKWVAFLKKYPTASLTVGGHADERGTAEYNLALGAKRADSVKNFLISQGVPAARLKVVSYGKTQPAVAGSTEESWSKNRRAQGTIN